MLWTSTFYAAKKKKKNCLLHVVGLKNKIEDISWQRQNEVHQDRLPTEI